MGSFYWIQIPNKVWGLIIDYQFSKNKKKKNKLDVQD